MIRYVLTSILIIMVLILLIVITSSLFNILTNTSTLTNLSRGVINGIGGLTGV